MTHTCQLEPRWPRTETRTALRQPDETYAVSSAHRKARALRTQTQATASSAQTVLKKGGVLSSIHSVCRPGGGLTSVGHTVENACSCSADGLRSVLGRAGAAKRTQRKADSRIGGGLLPPPVRV
eukprot:3460885-Rhodomonas_salina.4